MENQDPRSLPELMSDLAGDMATLVRKEGELVRAEVSEKVHQTARAGGEIAAGAILLLAALMVMLEALILALSKVMDPLWASIIVGVAVAAGGYMLVKTGLNMMKPENMRPERSVRQLHKDAQLMKEQVK
jgi:hypothetical protein